MKKLMKKCLIFSMALAMVLSSMSAFAFAAESTASASYQVTSYSVTNSSGNRVTTINKGDIVNIAVYIKLDSTSKVPTTNDVSRLVDSFSGGNATIAAVSGKQNEYVISVDNLQYKGTEQKLRLMVQNDSGYDTLEVTISEAKVYEESSNDDSSSYTPDKIPAPKAIFSRNDLGTDIKAGETKTLTISVKNVGKANMVNPVLTLTPSDALMIVGGTTAFEMTTINTGKTGTVSLQVKALSKIENASQYLEAKLDYDYYDRVSTVSTSAEGKISIPAKVTTATDTTDTDEVASPVPNIIVTKFNYGGQSVAAGSSFTFSFKFKNTSSELAIDNVVVTVDSGENLMLNGSSNSFFFDKIKAGNSKTVSIPMKAIKTLTVNSQTVSVSFKYEYVDQKKRTQATSDAKLSVPVYQPDKFEISKPVLPDYISEGDEVSITLNYVNKGKTEISNVEAALEGDVTSSLSTQTVGNVESGKNGAIVLSATAGAAGECEFDVKVTYEDSNGDSKERIFPVTMDVQAMEPYYPDDNVDDGGDTGDETGGFNWWILAAAAAILAIAATIILKKRKKAKAAKQEQALWDSWDNELGSDDNNAGSNSKGEK